MEARIVPYGIYVCLSFIIRETQFRVNAGINHPSNGIRLLGSDGI